MKRVHFLSAIVALILMGGLIALSTSTVYAAVACGDLIIAKTKLESNLDCSEYEGDALVIGADDVTIDLNGYTILSNGTGYAAIFGAGFSGTTIKNGAISGFEVGVLLFNASNSEIKRLSFMQQSTNGIAILDSRSVFISDVQTSLLPLTIDGETVAVFLFNVDTATIERVSAEGGFYGLMSIGGTKNYINGNSFTNVAHVGVRLLKNRGSVIENNQVVGDLNYPCYSAIDVVAPEASTRIQILNNILSKCGHGVFVVNNPTEPPTPPSRKISIRDNHISVTSDGVRLSRLQDSEVIGNHLHFNMAGIVLIESSLNNRITENVATGNRDWDMFHDESSTPNLWQDNTCVNAQGEDIDCP
jgi:parallel beta-helix repeat protein